MVDNGGANVFVIVASSTCRFRIGVFNVYHFSTGATELAAPVVMIGSHTRISSRNSVVHQ